MEVVERRMISGFNQKTLGGKAPGWGLERGAALPTIRQKMPAKSIQPINEADGSNFRLSIPVRQARSKALCISFSIEKAGRKVAHYSRRDQASFMDMDTDNGAQIAKVFAFHLDSRG